MSYRMNCRIVLLLLLHIVPAQTSCIQNCEYARCSSPTDLRCYYCTEGYFLNTSDTCVKCPRNCRSCRDSDYCSACTNGHFGKTCQEKCLTCLFGKCYKSGYCEKGCIDSYYDSRCSKLCSTTCLDRECTRSTGMCSKGCVQGYYGYRCDRDCPKQCLDKECENDGTCMKGCNEGYYGRKCDRTCSSKCLNQRCDERTGRCIEWCTDGYFSNEYRCRRYSQRTTCYSCKDGYFGDDCSRRCVNCNHLACHSITGRCVYRCEDGYYGDDCSKQCVNCKGRSCHSMSGRCTYGCADGYYLKEDQCHKCPERCVTCSSHDSCTACKPGFFGKECRDKCTNCLYDLCSVTSGHCSRCVNGYFTEGNTCSKCPNTCLTCASGNECRSCLPGYFGQNCSQTCPQGCLERHCIIHDGRCTGGCVDGYYDGHCTSNCSTNCLDNTCAKYSRLCTKGCISGFHGTRCERKCSTKCINGRCDAKTGACLEGCIDGYYVSGNGCSTCPHMDECYSCKLGYFGDGCANQCLLCKYQICDSLSGKCHYGCVEGWFLDDGECKQCPDWCLSCSSEKRCTACKAGFFGNECRNECAFCKNDACTLHSGRCKYGCLSGFYMDTDSCKRCPETCLTCSSNMTCGICTRGRFGRTCDETCSNGCFGNECDHTTGVCSKGCTKGNYGHRCDDKCSRKCLDGECESPTGFCTSGCIDGYFGQRCSWQCSDVCLNGRCDPKTGACTDGCIHGYTSNKSRCVDCSSVGGEFCIQQCLQCMNLSCSTDSGRVYDDCTDMCTHGNNETSESSVTSSITDETSATSVTMLIIAPISAMVGLAVIIVAALVLYRSIRARKNQSQTDSRDYTDIVPANARTVSEVRNDVYQDLDIVYEDVTPDVQADDAQPDVSTADGMAEHSVTAIAEPVYENVLGNCRLGKPRC